MQSLVVVRAIAVIGAIFFGTLAANAQGAGAATMLTPMPASTLATTTQDFTWGSTGASQYWLEVGRTKGGADIFNKSLSIGLLATVTNLPSDGSTIYARLWTLLAVGWVFNDYTYTAATIASGKAVMSGPAPNSTLTGSSQVFTWTTGTGVSGYWLYVGKTMGGNQYYDSQTTVTSTSATVNALPTDGSIVYVRLYSLISGVWQSNDYTYTAATIASGKAVMSGPAPNSTLTGSSQVFSWTTGTGVSGYWLYVGKTMGGNQYYDSQTTVTSTSATVNALPTDGSTVYVRLYSQISGVWQSNDYTYTAATIASGKAVMSGPAPNSTLTGSSQVFTWTTGTGVSGYWLYVGKTMGGNQYYDSRAAVTSTSATVNALPTDGSTVYVRLYSLISGVWQSNDYTYTAATIASGKAVMSVPAANSTLTGSSQVFTWTTGTGVSGYWLYVGKTMGGNQYYDSRAAVTSTSATVNALPTDGSTVYVRLYSQISGVWQSNDYTYTAATIVPVISFMVSPTNGATLSGTTQTFTWSPGSAVSRYWLSVGTVQGGSQILDQSFGLGTTATTVTGIPADGGTVYVRLWSLIGSNWQYVDYSYLTTNLTGGVKAVMTSPTPGTSFASQAAYFTWSTAVNAQEYWLYVGDSFANPNYYSSSHTTSGVLSAGVSGLPTDGRAIYVRLSTKINGIWYNSDYTYNAVYLVGAKAVVTYPANGLRLGASQYFIWSPGTNVSEYWADVGSSLGGKDYFSQSLGTATSYTYCCFPGGSHPVYVRLWSKMPQGWGYNDYLYYTPY